MDFRNPKTWKEGNNFTIEEITKGANISKGSFYSFYNSGEELFWDIIKLEEQTTY